MSNKETQQEAEKREQQATDLAIKESHLKITPVPRSLLTMSQQELERLRLLAEMLAKSRLAFKRDGQAGLNEGDFFLIMAKGLEVGFDPMAALDGITIIGGKPTIDPASMLALANAYGLLEDMQIVEKSAERSVIMMKRLGRSPLTHTFTIEDARRMKTRQRGQEIPLTEKDNWQQQPEVMLQWRNISAMCRILFGDVLKGLRYTPEEMGAIVEVDDAGNMIVIDTGDSSPAPSPRQLPAQPQPAQQPAPAPEPKQQTKQQPPAQQQTAKKTAGETWLKSKREQDALAKFLRDAGYTEADKDKWLSLIEPGRTLTRFGESTLTKEQFYKRVGEIALELNPRPQPSPTPEKQQEPQAAENGLPNPVLADAVYYMDGGTNTTKYLAFVTDAGTIRAYGRTTTFRKAVGDDYYRANGFDDMEANTDEPYEIDTLEITWERKSPKNGNPYLTATAFRVVSPDEDEPSGDPLDEFFNNDDFMFHKQAEAAR